MSCCRQQQAVTKITTSCVFAQKRESRHWQADIAPREFFRNATSPTLGRIGTRNNSWLTGRTSFGIRSNLSHSIQLVTQITILGESGHIFLAHFRPTVTPQYVRENQARTRPLGPKPGTTVRPSKECRLRAPVAERKNLSRPRDGSRSRSRRKFHLCRSRSHGFVP